MSVPFYLLFMAKNLLHIMIRILMSHLDPFHTLIVLILLVQFKNMKTFICTNTGEDQICAFDHFINEAQVTQVTVTVSVFLLYSLYVQWPLWIMCVVLHWRIQVLPLRENILLPVKILCFLSNTNNMWVQWSCRVLALSEMCWQICWNLKAQGDKVAWSVSLKQKTEPSFL